MYNKYNGINIITKRSVLYMKYIESLKRINNNLILYKHNIDH